MIKLNANIEISAHVFSEIICQNRPNDSCGHKTVSVTHYLYSRPRIYLKLLACLSLNILALPME